MTSSNWLFFYMKERQSLFSSTYEEQPGEGMPILSPGVPSAMQICSL